MDMAQFVIPKSDQLNSDDLLSGPRTIRITKVSGTGNADQPVAVYFDGDGDKPYLPCKGMRRVMIAAWGVDATQYVGRSMVLYREPKVVFGGMEVGGIRISAMSHISQPLNLALTVTKAKRAPYRVSPLVATAEAPVAEPPVERSKPANAWDNNVETGHVLGNPGTREKRYFATVDDWCEAICAISGPDDDVNKVWKTNEKIWNRLADTHSNDPRIIGKLAAAKAYLTAPDLSKGPGA